MTDARGPGSPPIVNDASPDVLTATAQGRLRTTDLYLSALGEV